MNINYYIIKYLKFSKKMDEETPRFCATSESYFNEEEISKVKPKKRHSLLNTNNFFYLNVKKSLLEKNKNNINNNKIIKIKLRNNSVKFKVRQYKINDIEEFMKKGKFKLRNDFDKKNVEKFISSKEEAFENSFLQIKDAVNK